MTAYNHKETAVFPLRHGAAAKHGNSTEWFRKFSQFAATIAGSSGAFILGVVVIAVWALSGPMFQYSEQWQLVVNTGTTIITFLMVFVIQNTQSRDSKEIHLKLDELLRAVENARNAVIKTADLSDEELQEIEAELQKCAGNERNAMR